MARVFYSEVAVLTDEDTEQTRALKDIEVTVTKRDGTEAQIYNDAVLESIKSNPFITGRGGAIEFWAEVGSYNIALEDTHPSPRIEPVTLAWDAIAFDDVLRLLPPGAICPTACRAAPASWLMCDGSVVSRTVFNRLWDALRTDAAGVLTASSPYGNGDGSSTFALPDLRGRLAIGADKGANRHTGEEGAFSNDVPGAGGAHSIEVLGVNYMIKT